MELNECIRRRESCRFFKSTPVDINLVERIISEALRCPSGKDMRPWRIRVLLNKEDISVLGKESKINKWIKKAPVVLVIMLDKNKKYEERCDYLGSGAFIQNLLLTACNYQVASCWIGEKHLCTEQLGEKLSIDVSKYEIVSYVALGYSGIEGEHAIKDKVNVDEYLS